MRTGVVAGLFTLSAAVLSPSGAWPETLAEAAAREKARRKGESAKVFGDDDLKASKGTLANDGAPVAAAGKRQFGLYPGGAAAMIVFDPAEYPPLSLQDEARLRQAAPNQGVLSRLASRDPLTSATACRTLEGVDLDTPGVAKLLDILSDPTDPCAARQCLAPILAFRASALPGLPAVLATVMKDKDQHVRRQATWASVVYARDDQRIRGLLTEALRDPVQEVRLAAAASLDALGEDATFAVPALIEALSAEWPWKRPADMKRFRISLIQALRWAGPRARAAIPVLTELAALPADTWPHDVGAAARSTLVAIERKGYEP
jgi:hypothetical protein